MAAIRTDFIAKLPSGKHHRDLNKYEFPGGNFDFVFFLGVLEYIHDVTLCLQRSREAAPHLTVTYCTNLSPDISYRRELRWVNDFTREEFEALLEKAGWIVESCDLYKNSVVNAQYIWKCRAIEGV